LLAHRYRVWSWGDRISSGGDCIEKRHVGLTGIAKRHRTSPYEVYNELVAMALGRILGLPIPIGFVLEDCGNLYYCSGNFFAAGGEAPDADIEHLAANERRIACGVVLFDAWIGNRDRHSRNIFYDIDGNRLHLFDHGDSLLNYAGVANLEKLENTIEVHEDVAREVFDFSSFRDWHRRLLAIPDLLISDIAWQAASAGVKEEEARDVAAFLRRRRAKLPDLFEANVSIFEKYRADLFSPFRDHDDPIDYSI
jgi:hypothetical protein